MALLKFIFKFKKLIVIVSIIIAILTSLFIISGYSQEDSENFVFAWLKFKVEGSKKPWDECLYYPEAWANLRRYLISETNIKVREAREVVSLSEPDKLFKYPFIFMTSNYGFILSDDEIRTLREYFLRGGFLYADDCILNDAQPDAFSKAFLREIRRVIPEGELSLVSKGHPIYHCFYDFSDGMPQVATSTPRQEGWGMFYNEKLVAFLTTNDLHCAWYDGLKWYGEQPAINGFKMGINIIVYALSH